MMCRMRNKETQASFRKVLALAACFAVVAFSATAQDWDRTVVMANDCTIPDGSTDTECQMEFGQYVIEPRLAVRFRATCTDEDYTISALVTNGVSSPTGNIEIGDLMTLEPLNKSRVSMYRVVTNLQVRHDARAAFISICRKMN